MRLDSRSKHRQRGATIVLMMLLMPALLIPLVGLAIDASRLYIVQSKLSCALDGAVLGAGRLLGTNANTTEIAGEFLRANFPSGFWGSTNFTSNITYANNLGAQTITVQAQVTVPTTFIRILGIPANVLGDTAVATRRVTRVEIVLDRSGSMNNTDPITGQNVFTMMQAGAEWFASQFTPGYDEVGLVVFSGSGIVAYPETRPYVADPTLSTGGPDKNFATNPATQTGQIFDQLKAMAVGGGTATPEALALAYIELRKAHNRDLAANGSDNTLNTIVLFTDGVPDSIATYANDPNSSNNTLKTFGTGSSHSKCTNNPATATNTTTQMKGYIVSPGGPPGNGVSFPGWGTSIGLALLGAYDTTHTLSWWLGTNGANDNSEMLPTSALAGCAYLCNNGSNCTLNDMAKLPPVDLYVNPTNTGGYTHSYMFDGTNYWSPNTGAYDPTTPTTGYNLSAAAWNAVDAQGATIRGQTAMNQIQIFTIGYSGNSGTDIGLLKRLANTPDSSSFISTQSIGQFYLVNNTSELAAAFDAVASNLLRLAQ